MGLMRVYLPGAGWLGGELPNYCASDREGHRFWRGGVGSGKFCSRIRQNIAPNFAMARYPLDVG